jgi:hypothetical protein
MRIKNSFVNLLVWWKIAVAKLNYDYLVFQGIVLFLFVFASAFLPSPNLLPLSKNDTNTNEESIERNKILIPVIWGIELSLVTLYLSAVGTKLKYSEEQRIILSVPNQDLEYLSLINSALGEMPDRLDGISDEIDNLRRTHGESRFLEILKENVNDYRIRQDALNAIFKGLENHKDINGLHSTIVAATIEAIGEDGDKNSYLLFLKCMYAYISAWLVCSIDNKRNIKNDNCYPIDSIFYQDQDRKYLYIKAINDFSDRLNYKPPRDFFINNASISLVQSYLKDLVALISQKEVKP